MKNPTAIAVFALFIGSVALVLSAIDLSSTESQEAGVQRITAGPPDADLVAQLETLSGENRDLRDRLAMLEVKAVPAPRAPAPGSFASKAEFEDFREEVGAALASIGVAGGAGADGTPRFQEKVTEAFESEAFDQQVAEAVSSIQKREASDRSLKSYDSRLQRLAEKLPGVAEKLGLTHQQEVDLESSLHGLYAKQAEYGLLYAEGVPRVEIGEMAQENLAIFNDELSGILTPDQHAAYGELGDKASFPGSE